MNLKQFLTVTLGCALLLSPAALGARPAQEQGQESVADAARKAQAARKDAPKAKIVLDNDNLDTLKGTVNVVGQESTPTDGQSNAAGDKTKVAAPAGDKSGPAKGEDYWRKEFADANKKLADDSHELDVDQRDYNLKQQQYFSDPNTAMKEQYSRQDLTDLKTKIDALTGTVAQDKQAISDLEDALRQAGGDPGWASAPQAPAPAAQAQ